MLFDERTHQIDFVGSDNDNIGNLISVAHILIAITLGGIVIDRRRIDRNLAVAYAVSFQIGKNGTVRALDFGVDCRKVVADFLGHNRPCDLIGIHFFLTKAADCDHTVAICKIIDAGF